MREFIQVPLDHAVVSFFSSAMPSIKRQIDTEAASTQKKQKHVNAEEYYQKHNIIFHGDASDFPPCLDFDDAGFSSTLSSLWKGFDAPTPIQAACWNALKGGRDVVGIAQTGSGKTLAFSLPAMSYILTQGEKKKKKFRPQVLILAPTRELALQTHVVVEKQDAVSSACIYGGVSKSAQRDMLKKAQFLIATPGRLIDFVEEGELKLDDVKFLVLDEADRMLDAGFEQDVRKIIKACHTERQTLMFSATWPMSVRSLASEFMKPEDGPNALIRVTIGNVDHLTANERIEQHVHVLADGREKDGKLLGLLNQVHGKQKNRVLVFALYKKEASRLEAMLAKQGWNVGAIHGDKSQSDREAALNAFRSGKCPLLVATDVAARGLDIPGVEYVINYTFPLTIEDYVHRIGRTGRAGASGVAHTFFTTHDKAHAGALSNILRKADIPVPDALLKFGGTVKKKENKNYGAFFKEIDPNVKGTKIVFD